MADDDDDHDETRPGFFARMRSRPVLSGLAAGILAFIFIVLLLPPAPAPVEGVSVAIDAMPAAEGETAAQAQAQADAQETEAVKEAPALAEEAPAASVPIAAEAAVVVTDAGLNHRVASAIDSSLPREITLAVSSYATDPAGTAAAFKTSGRDVWLQIAAQSVKGGIDPGPLAVSSGLSAKENAELINRQLAMAGGNVIGVFVPADADLTLKQDMWKTIASDLIAGKRMILDATPAKVATSVYMQSQISAYLKADSVINAGEGPTALARALDAAVPVILKHQQAIVVVSGLNTASIETLSRWIKDLAAKGIRLVPASKFTGLTQ